MEQGQSGRVLVTSGPTRAYIDRVRYIANTSSGALGSLVVSELLMREIPVVHLYGIGSETPDTAGAGSLYESVQVTTVDDLIAAVRTVAGSGDIAAVVHAMAVLDYVPASTFEGKKKSGKEETWDIRLVRTPKVIGIMRELMPEAFFVGFKLEAGVTEDHLAESALGLLRTYSLDLVVANDLDTVDRDRHEAICFGKGEHRALGRFTTKAEIAGYLAGVIAGR